MIFFFHNDVILGEGVNSGDTLVFGDSEVNIQLRVDLFEFLGECVDVLILLQNELFSLLDVTLVADEVLEVVVL